MAVITTVLWFLLLACTALAQMIPVNPGCGSTSSTRSRKTIAYTQTLPVQNDCTSTVWGQVVSTTDYVIYCSNGNIFVTNVLVSPTPTGSVCPLTAVTTVPALTIGVVSCIPSSNVVTRGEIEAKTTSAEHPTPTPRLPHAFLEGLQARKRGPDVPHKAAQHLKAKRQAIPATLSPAAAALVSQLQTAQYGLELCNSDFDLTQLCQELRDPAAIEPLASVGVSSSQAGDIVCFCSVYGLDLGTTNAALLGDLAAAVYGLELGDNFTTTTNTTKLCNNLDLAAAPDLGIDASAVNNFICGGPSTSVTVTAVTTQTVVVVPGNPTVTITASGHGNSGGFPSPSGAGTGAPYGWPNGTFPYQTAGSAVSGGYASGDAAPTGAGSPWGNSTGTDSLDIAFPPASVKIPAGLDSSPYYPVSTLLTTTTSMGGYA